MAVKPAAPAPAIKSPLINAESPSWDGNAPRKSALRWLYVGVTRDEPLVADSSPSYGGPDKPESYEQTPQILARPASQLAAVSLV